jgi:hypothetical protein
MYQQLSAFQKIKKSECEDNDSVHDKDVDFISLADTYWEVPFIHIL